MLILMDCLLLTLAKLIHGIVISLMALTTVMRARKVLGPSWNMDSIFNDSSSYASSWSQSSILIPVLIMATLFKFISF